ncbi:multidrug resistance protein 3 (p glycoprotein 3) [Colletotrichum truncatum]|uniref:Multidrug resistance protein 3 (P glycoprotein 3) n=1 Tax=Colletotrichum truncatum TaxID=5467 RepID=A0ACC3ZF77_COLTU|nr:multidrug resistance protein 3 (p glycoprotein 3) [Colletotrichum truncatum]KAF6801650.1 multidrug resistance protein 3 (p glycoprotein 3) [Colletotrichum truncatum]
MASAGDKDAATDSPRGLVFGGSHSREHSTSSGARLRLEEPKKMSAMRAYMRIFTHLDPKDIVLELIAVAAAAVSGTGLALVNLVLGRLITVITNFISGISTKEQFMDDVIKHCLYFVYIGAGRMVCTYIYMTLSTYTAFRMVRNVRRRFLQAALSQSISFFDMNSNSVSTQAATNGNLIQSGVAEKLMICVQAASTFISAFVIAFTSYWKLTLILTCVPPALITVIGTVATLEAKIETQMLDVFSEAASYAESLISTLRTVQAFGSRIRLLSHYEIFLNKAQKMGAKKSPLYGALFSMEYSIMYAAIGLAFWQGTKMIARNEVADVGAVFIVIMSVIVATLTFTIIAPYMITFQRAATAATQLFALIDRKNDMNPFDQHSGEKPAEAFVTGEVDLQNITFSYPARPGVTVLDDFTLRIPAGKVTALVGASGSGKSTIVGLLERWYEPASGSIKLNGIPIENLNLTWLRTHIRLVQQEPVLFNGTVFENIANGLVGTPWENASAEEQQDRVENAAKLAFAHEFITEKLPEGYDTIIGERGGLLSGGQKQRIAIARSIISEPKILLLDEATSALDPHAEGVVQKALESVSKNRTTIVIAHKLATIRNADNIVVMNKGHIVEQGTHESLIKAEGTYARLVQIQDLTVKEKDATQKEQTESIETATEKEDSDLHNVLTNTKTVEQQQDSQPQSLNDRYNFDKIRERGLINGVLSLVRENPELRWHFLIIGITCVLGAGALPGQSILMARVMDVFRFEPHRLEERGAFYSLMFFILGLGTFANYFTLGYATNAASQKMLVKYRRDLLDGLLRQDMQFFDRPENTIGSLTGRIDSVAQAILELMSVNVVLILITLFTIVACATLSIATSWKLGLVGVFAGLVPLSLGGYARIRLEMRMDQSNQKRFSESAAIASESVLAIRTVSSLAIEGRVLKRYTDGLDQAIHQSTLPLFHMMIWFSFTQSVEYFILALGFWWGCTLVKDAQISFYQFFVSFMGVFFAGNLASTLFSYTSSITKGKAATHFYLWVKSLQPTVQQTEENRLVVPDKNVETIDINGVKFSYPLRPDVRVLKNVDLNIRSGEFVALVGASGCGKSTIVSLLERFYDPTSGCINIDNVKLATMNPDAYRSHVALVQQEPTLYPTSIRENVLLGLNSSPSSTTESISEDEAVEKALRAANAWEFVSSLPEGVNTLCGTNGSQLSGGQRQRIAIARALIRKPRLLLLDEATSALDTESEKIVQNALAESDAGDRVTIAVAHRLSTVKEANRICVFSGGRIVEQGTHAELWAYGGVYKQLCEAQSLDA